LLFLRALLSVFAGFLARVRTLVGAVAPLSLVPR
jgi:hypothetical protein